MEYKEKLFKLMATLNKNEKGYFKKFGQFNGENGKLLFSFFDKLDVLIKQEKSESDIKLKLKSFSFLEGKNDKAIHNFKTQLYSKIIDALLIYEQPKTTELQILHHYKSGLLLNNRKLLDQALLEFNKALKLAEKSNNELLQPMIYIKIITLTQKITSFNDEIVLGFYKKLLNLTQGISQFVTHRNIEFQTLRLTNRVGQLRDEATKKQLLDFAEQIEIDKYEYFNVKNTGFIVLSNIYWLLNDKDNTLKYLKQNIDLYNLDKPIHTDTLNGLAPVLYNYTQQLILAYKKDLFQIYFKKFDDIKTKNSQRLLEKTLFKTIVAMFANFHFGDYKKNEMMQKQLWQFIDENLINQFSHKVHMLVYFISHSLLILKKYDESLNWINFLLDKKLDLRQDTKVYINLASLIIYYEKQNLMLLPYKIKSSEYTFRNKIEVTKSEKEIFSLFKKLVNLIDKSEIKKAFKSSKTKILKLMQEDEKEKAVSWSFDIIAWLDSKIEDKNFGKILADKKQKHEV